MPEAITTTPVVVLAALNVSRISPMVNRTNSNVNKTTTQVSKSALKVRKVAPKVSKSASKVRKSTLEIIKSAPEVIISTPKIIRPAPVVPLSNALKHRLFDTKVSKDFLQKEIIKCIDLAKDGVHGILYVVSVRNRFTAEEAAVLDSLKVLFGPNILNYMVVVFTGGDELEDDDLTLDVYLNDCPQQLQEVLQRCNMRMVLFNNKTTLETKKEKQRAELLKQIDKIISENGGQPYSFEPFRDVQASSEKLLLQHEHTRSGRGFSKEEMEKAEAEQLGRLNYMMEQNLRATEEKVQELTKKVGEQLAYSETARIHAENEARSVKEKSDEEIRKLRKEIEKTKHANHSAYRNGRYDVYGVLKTCLNDPRCQIL